MCATIHYFSLSQPAIKSEGHVWIPEALLLAEALHACALLVEVTNFARQP